MTRVAVIGASGFVGSAIACALEVRRAHVLPVRAPRLTRGAGSVEGLRQELRSELVDRAVQDLRQALAGSDVVVNAAGLATATSDQEREMLGANALLPAVVAAASPATARIVHISSAAVQGRRQVLDESDEMQPFSPYSRSKALGERGARDQRSDVVIFRPTSVHGRGRAVTASLAKVLSSPLASVAGAGDRPTPQVLVENVADAVAFVALTEETPPPVVLQPYEGLTTAGLVEVVGGRRPVRVPDWLARGLVGAGTRLGRFSAKTAGVSRRLEMLWFGQEQVEGWLHGRWEPPVGREGWKDMAGWVR